MRVVLVKSQMLEETAWGQLWKCPCPFHKKVHGAGRSTSNPGSSFNDNESENTLARAAELNRWDHVRKSRCVVQIQIWETHRQAAGNTPAVIGDFSPLGLSWGLDWAALQSVLPEKLSESERRRPQLVQRVFFSLVKVSVAIIMMPFGASSVLNILNPWLFVLLKCGSL